MLLNLYKGRHIDDKQFECGMMVSFQEWIAECENMKNVEKEDVAIQVSCHQHSNKNIETSSFVVALAFE